MDASRSQRLLPWLLGLACVAGIGGPTAHARDPRVREWIDVLEQYEREPFEQERREKAIRELGRLGGREAAEALLPVFDDPFVHLHDHAVSAWIAMLKGSQAAESQTWLSARALGERNPAVRRAAAVALGLTSGREIEEPLRLALAREKDATVLAALAQAAARLREKPALRGILASRANHRDGRAAFALALAAATVDGADAAADLLPLLKHRDPLGRAGGVLALQQLDALPANAIEGIVTDRDPEPPMALAETLALRTRCLPWPQAGRPILERLLAHPSWRVRAAAVQGALRVWDNAIVEPLVDRLPVETGRLGDDVRRALETYSGRAIGQDADLWRAWWRQNEGAFDPGTRPAPDPGGDIPFREAGAAGPDEGTRTVAFFDLPLRSQRLAFVFDLSGSMGNPAKEGQAEGTTKLDLLRQEFEKTLTALPPETLVDVLVYRYWSSYPPKTDLTRALGRPQPCSPTTVRKALAWMRKQEAKGWGAFFEPLAAALDEDVDTVVLLSDGRPSRGVFDRDERILDEFPRANRFRRLAVHTVLVGTKGADRKFMQALAAATGGRFRAVGGE